MMMMMFTCLITAEVYCSFYTVAKAKHFVVAVVECDVVYVNDGVKL